MNNTFATFQRFHDPELANTIAEKLREHNLEVLIESGKFLDPTFPGSNSLNADIELKLKQTDFTKADDILEAFYSESLDDVDEDYYLLKFSNYELSEIIAKPDEWGKFDFQLAKKLLKERGVDISDEKFANLKATRLKQLSKAEKVSRVWMVLGYIAAFLGGFLGIIFGWIVAYSKKTLPDGNKVFTYAEQDRKHAKRIFYLSLVTVTASLILRLKYT